MLVDFNDVASGIIRRQSHTNPVLLDSYQPSVPSSAVFSEPSVQELLCGHAQHLLNTVSSQALLQVLRGNRKDNEI